jgi:glycosyltransferase involved in cell wall biosynthesis
MTRLGLLTNEFLPIAGGIGTYAMEVARAAVAQGHEVTLLAPSFGRQTGHVDRQLPFRVLRYPARGAALRDYATLLPAALALARAADIDVLHACDSSSLAALSVTQPLHRRQFLATIHGSDVKRAGAGAYRQVARLAGFYTRPQRILANSHYTRSLLLDNCPGVDPARVIVTPLGVASSWFEPAGDAECLRELGVQSAHQLIVCVARITARKGQIAAVKAFGKLPEDQRRGARLLLIGAANPSDARYEAELQRVVRAGAPGVILGGKLAMRDVRSIYARARLFVLPGGTDGPWVEGFGLVFLEAAAQGLPAVAGRQGGVAEAVVHERTGLLVEPGDVDALALAMQRLLGDAELCHNLGQQARARARTFTWERCAAQTYADL